MENNKKQKPYEELIHDVEYLKEVWGKVIIRNIKDVSSFDEYLDKYIRKSKS